ncbi:AAA family ATPase [Roseomonas stagni]|uniref:AAA family ATPase n=1 Tax=Falsiroseomonas algicola TaxID=2716930 RepID=A0A6M1LE02_9PROT|nr:AAA family ATPase [Falsiroseomonas algicola]NGM18486.1 AAA family ATPase [Falsiroseomonas algicola]
MPAESPSRPVFTVLCGPNGSGKSTLHARLAPPGRFLNADTVAAALDPGRPEAATIRAGREILTDLADAISAGDSFAWETTLSSRQSIAAMRRARQAGYEISVAFVTLRSADLAVVRVAERVARGGHAIPEEAIRRRYETAFRQLPEAIRLCDAAMLFDNSRDGPHLLVRIEAHAVVFRHLQEAVTLHRRLAASVAEALAIPACALFDDVPSR